MVAGEASGCDHATHLIPALQQLMPKVTIDAVGNEAMQSVGANIIIDSKELSVMGFSEVLTQYKKIKNLLNKVKHHLTNENIDLLILIDYPGFNLPLAEHAKQLNIPVLYYICPKTWASREKRVEKLRSWVNHMAAIIPFEEAYFTKHGISTTYVGNPIISQATPTLSKEESYQAFSLDSSRPVISLLPGSRKSEVSRLAPLFSSVSTLLAKKYPDWQFVIPVASSINREWLQQLEISPAITLIDGRDNYNLLQISSAAIVASGTATLETAYMDVPQVCAYKASFLSYFIGSRIVTISLVSLANIIAEKEVIKEYIQKNATIENLSNELESLMNNEQKRIDMRKNYADIRHKLGSNVAANETAKIALGLLKN